MGSRVTSLGVFTISKHTISVADRNGVSGAILRSSAVGGLPGRFHHPCLGMARAGPSREHRPPAWGQHGVLYNNQKLMTAFPIPVMLGTGLAARRPRFRLQHRIVSI